MDHTQLASDESIAKTKAALEEKSYEVMVVDIGAEALEKIKTLIPKGASVTNGASITLEQIGYIEYLKSGEHGWDNLKAKILAEEDKEKQRRLRKEASLADYYLGSVHGVAENGEFVIGSNTSSQLPSVVFASQNLIFVVSTKKIVPTLADAMKRLEEHVLPLEDKSIMEKYQAHTQLSKVVIFKAESKGNARTIRFIFVKEDLGF